MAIDTAEKYFSQSSSAAVSPQRYSYSFSGADTRVLAYFPDRPDLMSVLDTVHTVSISVHEAKSQVRSLGYRGIKGLTRSIRTIAGSMIFIVVNDHPLRTLMNQYVTMGTNPEDGFFNPLPFGWSVDRDDAGVGALQDTLMFENRLSGLLPPFNLVMEMVSETAPAVPDYTSTVDPSTGKSKASDPLTGKGTQATRTLFPGAGLLLQDIEFIDEGFVVSVNDMVTEITCSYIARDFKPISANTFHSGGKALTKTEIQQRQWDLWKRCNPDQATTSGTIFTPGFAFGEGAD